MFMSNNRPLLDLWLKGNLVKHRKVAKYYKTDCLQNFIFVFMLLLTVKFIENRHMWDRIFFIFLKILLKQT